MRPSLLNLKVAILLLALFAFFRGAAFAQSFQIAPSQIDAAVAPGFNHSNMRVPITGAAPGFDFTTLAASSDAAWVTPSIDTQTHDVVLAFNTAGLVNSSNTATITVTGSGTTDFFTLKASVAPLNVTKLVDDPVRSRVYGVHQTGLNTGAVIVIDPITNTNIGCITVGKKPTDLAVSPDGSELLVINAVDQTISAIDLATLRLKQTILLPTYVNWGVNDTTADVAYGPGNIIYYTDGSWAPVLYVFNRDSGQVTQQITDNSNGIGDFALSPDGSKLYAWIQYGWSAGSAASYLVKYSVATDGKLTFVERTTSNYPNGLLRDPLDTPVLIDSGAQHVFAKQLAVNPASLSDTQYAFPGAVNSISPGGEVAATASAIYQVSTGNNLYSLPATASVQTITSDYARLVYFNSTSRTIGAIDLMAAIGPQVLNRNLSPADGAITLAPQKLEWTPLPGVSSYRVYFGQSETAVQNAGTTDAAYLGETSLPTIELTASLTPGTKYYWRVDAVTTAGVTKGDVYEFTVSPIGADISKIVGATVQGHSAYDMNVQLTSSSGNLAWQATADQPWVGFVATSGTAPGTLTVRLNASQLSAGVNTATVTVTSGGQPAFTLPVSLTVDPLQLTVIESDRSSSLVYALSEQTAAQGVTSRAYLLELDSAAKSIKRVVRVGSSATDLAVHNAEGRIYVANWMAGQLLAIDKTTFQQVRSYAFSPFGSTGYGEGDVYRIAAGAQGRLLVEEEDQWITVSIFDTLAGTKLTNLSTVREGGGKCSMGGRYYYHGDNNISNAEIHKYDLIGDQFSQTAHTRVQSVNYYGSRTVVVSENGERVFWNGGVFDKDLTVKWLTGDEIFSTSADGKLAFSATKIYDVDLQQAVLSMPVNTKVSAYNSTSGRLVVQVGSQVKFFDVGGSTSLPAPTLSLQGVTANTVQLTWNDDSLESGFTLQRRLAGDTQWQDVSSSIAANTTSYTVTGLTGGQGYEFRIKADSSTYTSAWSNTLAATTAPPVLPTAITLAASSISASTATLNGTANPNGRSTTVYFEYGLTTSYGSSTSSQSIGQGTANVSVSQSASQLAPGVLYHFRLVAVSSDGTTRGADQTLTTLSAKPTVSSVSLGNDLTSSSVTLHGLVNPSASATTAYFQYGTTPSFGQSSANVALGSGTTSLPVDIPLSGLLADTIYYYRLVATNAAGTTTSAPSSFRTLVATPGGLVPPTATSLQASVLSSSAAILNGSANPNGRSTTAYFEYGLTTSYGSISAIQSIGQGATSMPVSQLLGQLAPGTLYHYRLVAVSADGVSRGLDQIFATLGAPTVSTVSAGNDLTSSSVTLHGSVNPNGTTSTAWFEYGTTSSLGQSIGSVALGNGTVSVSVDCPLSGLSPNTTYYYRLVATNAAGPANSAIASFITLPTPLVATDDVASTASGQPRIIDVLANDKGDSLRLLSVGHPWAGAATPNPDGTITYAPGKAFAGNDVFTYTVVDGAGGTATATVNINDTFLACAGSYHALVGSSDSVYEDAGAIIFTISSAGNVTGKLSYAGACHSFKGILRYDGVALIGVKRGAKPPLLVNLEVDPSSGQVSGGVSGPDGTSLFSAFRNSRNQDNPTPRAGQYTLLLPPDSGAAGYGYATMRIDPEGGVRLIGRSGSGIPFSCAAMIGGDDQFPLYAVMTKPQRASYHGWVAFRNITGISDCDGTIGCSSASANTSSQIALIGSRYIASNPGYLLLPFSAQAGNAVFEFGRDGDSLTEAPVPVTLSSTRLEPRNRELSALKLNRQTGLFSGTLSLNRKAAHFSGVLFQRQALGAGFIKAKGGPGWVILHESAAPDTNVPTLGGTLTLSSETFSGD